MGRARITKYIKRNATHHSFTPHAAKTIYHFIQLVLINLISSFTVKALSGATMHSTPLPAKLPGPPLNDREAIIDTCYRAFASVDHADEELLKSSCTSDIHTEIAGKVCNGYDELRTKGWENVSSNLDTIHYITNVRVSIDDPTTARVTFTSMAVHCRLGKGYEPGPNKFTTGAIFNCDVIKVDDDWRLKTMISNHIWAEGDPSIMAGH